MSEMASYHHHSDRSARRSSSRPRSLYTAQGSSPYLSSQGPSSSSYLSSPYLNSASSYQSTSAYQPYSSPLSSSYGSSPYSSQYSSYGGTNSGYGGLTLPSSSLYNLSSSPKTSPTSSYLSNLLQSSNYGSRTASPTSPLSRTSSPQSSFSQKQRSIASRSNSFNRNHPSTSTSLGSRSLSALSLRSDKSDLSEGYVVS